MSEDRSRTMAEGQGKTDDRPRPSGIPRGFAARLMAVAPWALIALGIALRLRQYLFNRSLWLDESYLSLNIIHRTFGGLLKPLDYNQAAPIGFLMVQKAFVTLFGTGEMALRLFPFLCGIASLFLFYAVTRRCLRPPAMLLALGLFATSCWLIYYSAEVKQYGVDLAVALGLALLGLRSLEDGITRRGAAFLAVAGAVAIWFSHPAAFVLGGVGGALLLRAALRRDKVMAFRTTVAVALWLLSFAACYLATLRSVAGMSVMQAAWSRSFMPLPPFGHRFAGWMGKTYSAFFGNPGGLGFKRYAGILFAIGGLSLLGRKPERLALLLIPAIAALSASALHLYPFTQRFLLFLVPTGLLVMASSLDIACGLPRRIWPRAWVILWLAAALPLLWPNTGEFRLSLLQPVRREEIKPVLQYLRDHRQPEDAIYVYYSSQFPLKYYAERYGFQEGEWIAGARFQSLAEARLRGRPPPADPGMSPAGEPEAWVGEIQRLRGCVRVWLLFSHDLFGAEELITDRLKYGKRLDEFRAHGATLLLYDLSAAANVTVPVP